MNKSQKEGNYLIFLLDYSSYGRLIRIYKYRVLISNFKVN